MTPQSDGEDETISYVCRELRVNTGLNVAKTYAQISIDENRKVKLQVSGTTISTLRADWRYDAT